MTAPAGFRPCPPTVPPRIWAQLSPHEQAKAWKRWRGRFAPPSRPMDEVIPPRDQRIAPRVPRVRKGPPPPQRVMDWDEELPGRVTGWLEDGLSFAQAVAEVGVTPEHLARKMNEADLRDELARLRANGGARRALDEAEFLRAAWCAAEDGLSLSAASAQMGMERRTYTRRLERSVEGRAVLDVFRASRA